ncbi:YjaG family protein [Marinobacter sp. X15-166B]|uniref:YjaG family protein n=1 Tax=Marinobacter sp. X15-166B TaxID=1897620 RepID=UPI00085BEABB|nr:YjaG family protein [Marinobacter sp. X15-166B]OEY67800.1 hypothetical protein BG841_16125 [Marinobacter sp. X15-166B]
MNANQFLKAVEQLQGWREYVFLLALAERGFPNYALFATAMGLKTGAKMRRLLDAAWELVQHETPEAQAPQLLARLEGMAPDVDAYEAYGVYPAFAFCQLFEQALLNRVNPVKHRATDASQLARETVMGFVEFSEGEGLGESEFVRLLDQHPLMKDEKVFQRELVLALKRQRTPLEVFVTEVREGAANKGVSNLGISLQE